MSYVLISFEAFDEALPHVCQDGIVDLSTLGKLILKSEKHFWQQKDCIFNFPTVHL